MGQFDNIPIWMDDDREDGVSGACLWSFISGLVFAIVVVAGLAIAVARMNL